MNFHYTFPLYFAFTFLQPVLALKDCFGATDNGAYLDWVSNVGSTSYPSAVCYNASSSDTTQGVAVHWKLDSENIYIAVAARATGFVGFGLAEGGGMRGSDMVIFETANPGKLRDAHVLDAFFPVDDVCQNWVFVNSHDEGGFLIFEAFRSLDTMDSQDHKIINDTETVIPAQRIIAAWGDSSTASYHELNFARGSLRWYGGEDELTLVKKKMEVQADGMFDLAIPNHTISTNETDYHSFCFAWDPDFTSQGVPPNGNIVLIAAEMIVADESRPYVHHLDVFATDVASNASRTCLASGYGFTVYSWAPGILPFVLPDNVGYGMGPTSPEKLQSFRIQVHYSNKEHIENVIDTSFLRVYYSLTPREHELGIMGMGDALSHLEGEPIPKGLSEFEFGCSSDCSSLALQEPVTVVQELFHMHAEGAAAVTYHIRNEKVIRQANVDFFDFEQAGLPTIRQAPFTVNPGDSFRTKFWFNSQNGTEFGIGTWEEMNKAIFLYYPAKKVLTYPWGCTYAVDLTACNASMTSRVLSTPQELERVFGGVPGTCQVPKSMTSASMGMIDVPRQAFLSTAVAVLVCSFVCSYL